MLEKSFEIWYPLAIISSSWVNILGYASFIWSLIGVESSFYPHSIIRSWSLVSLSLIRGRGWRNPSLSDKGVGNEVRHVFVVPQSNSHCGKKERWQRKRYLKFFVRGIPHTTTKRDDGQLCPDPSTIANGRWHTFNKQPFQRCDTLQGIS